MKNFFLSKIKSFLTVIVREEIRPLINEPDNSAEVVIALQQKQLLLQMSSSVQCISAMGFSVYSESDEDGLLLYIFSQIGFSNKFFVDIGGGRGLIGSNTANLVLNHGFNGLIVEGENENAEQLRKSYLSNKLTMHMPPVVITELAKPENINYLIENNGYSGEIDLLSIDIDSIDYWVWESLKVVSPRVVIVEIQCILDMHTSKAVPQHFSKTVFETFENKRYGIYNSASLLAFTKLASQKGYRLVATSLLGFNAIFIKNELGVGSLPTISVQEGLNKPFVKWAQNKFGEKIKTLEWIEV